MALIPAIIGAILTGIVVLAVRPAFAVKRLRRTYSFPLMEMDNRCKVTGLECPDIEPMMHIPGCIVIFILLHEDATFFLHRGSRGGFSLTEQLSKILFPKCRESSTAKFQVRLHTFFLEQCFSKREILSLYCHTVRLSGPTGVSGFSEASSYYLSKEVSALSLVEIIFLCGLIPNPIEFEEKILAKGRISEFRYKNAFERVLDYFRIVDQGLGLHAVNFPESISYDDGTRLMEQYESYRPEKYAPQEQAAFEVRAALVIRELYALIERLQIVYQEREVLAA